MSEYVTKLENGAYRIAGTRISLDSVVYAYKRGELPEQILYSFPLLTLEQIYGALAFYLKNRQAIDNYLNEGEIKFEKLAREWRKKNADLHKKIAKAREEVRNPA